MKTKEVGISYDEGKPSFQFDLTLTEIIIILNKFTLRDGTEILSP